MHTEAFAFLASVLTADRVDGAHIAELGSYNVNGSARDLCAAAKRYVGVDRRAGPGVDVVDPDDSYNGKGAFDIVVSSETLEHADDPAGLIASAWRALRPGGLLVLTAAGPDRTPHTCDGGPDPIGHGEYYANVSTEQLTELLAAWSDVDVRYGRSHGNPCGDVYATAIKPNGNVFVTNGPTSIIVGDDDITKPTAPKTRRRTKRAA